MLVAWVVWAGLDGQKPSVEATDTGHRLMNDERAVEVSWTLSVPPGERAARASLEAQDEDSRVVGWRVVEIPASDAAPARLPRDGPRRRARRTRV